MALAAGYLPGVAAWGTCQLAVDQCSMSLPQRNSLPDRAVRTRHLRGAKEITVHRHQCTPCIVPT